VSGLFSPLIFWPWLTGITILVIGLIIARKSFATARGLDKLIALGPAFFAASLAAFGAEHFSNVQGITEVVPPWMPVRIFWTCFVGLALISAGASIALKIQTRLSATLTGIMFACFVLMIHIPNVVANLHNRIVWAVAFRDLAFAGGAFALAAIGNKPLRIGARIFVGVPLLFFAFETFLHPRFAPGVPLAKLTPAWVPIGAFWGFLTGAALAFSGVALLVCWTDKWARVATASLGLLIVLLVIFLYLPIFFMADPSGKLEGLNYVFDTLLFAGAVLLVADFPI
jgi:uncharacterized membrane protein